MTNLPPGFDPAVWGEGWKTARIYKLRIDRDCKDGTTLGCVFVNGKCEVHHLWAKEGDPTGALLRGTEHEAAAFCEKYAADRGGWADTTKTKDTGETQI